MSERQISSAFQQLIAKTDPHAEPTVPSLVSVKQRFIEAAIAANTTVADHPLLSEINWSLQGNFETTTDYKKINQWGVIPAVCAIAETGNNVLKSQH